MLPEHALKPIPLPEALLESRRVLIAGILLDPCNEPLAIGRRRAPFDEEMQMIGHETVGNDCKLELFGGAQNLREHKINRGIRGEHRALRICAESQVIAVRTEI